MSCQQCKNCLGVLLVIVMQVLAHTSGFFCDLIHHTFGFVGLKPPKLEMEIELRQIRLVSCKRFETDTFPLFAMYVKTNVSYVWVTM